MEMHTSGTSLLEVGHMEPWSLLVCLKGRTSGSVKEPLSQKKKK